MTISHQISTSAQQCCKQFFELTRNLRQNTAQKSYAFGTEINQRKPDSALLEELQADISS